MFNSLHSPATTNGGAIPCVEIDTANVRLYFLSRDWKALALFIGVTLVLSTMLAWALRSPDRPATPPQSAFQVVKSLLTASRPEAAVIARAIIALDIAPPEGLENAISSSAISANDQFFLSAVVASLKAPLKDPTARLIILAHQVNPAAGPNEAVGSLYAAMGRNDRARLYYERELERHPSGPLREKLVLPGISWVKEGESEGNSGPWAFGHRGCRTEGRGSKAAKFSSGCLGSGVEKWE